MFTPSVRLLLLILLGILAVLFAYSNNVPLLLVTTFLSLFLLWDYLKRGTVPLSLSKIRKEDYKSADKIIRFTKYPDRLLKKEKIYYKFIRGFIERDQDNFDMAEDYLNDVKNANLKNDNDKAMTLLALADIAMIKGEKNKAKELVIEMKNLKVNPSMMSSIRKMQDWLGI